MRPLNRPMFRYGGPIKQGIMSGIREPKKTGGSMREAQQWNTVGSPVFPKDSSGRAHHVLPAWLAWTGLSAAARAAAPMIIRAGSSAATKRLATEAATRAALSGGATQAGKNVARQGITAATTGWKNLGKNWFSGDPSVKGAKWGWKALTSPTANTWAQKAAKMAISPTTLIGGAVYYLWPDGTKRKTPPPGSTGGAGKKPWESNEGMKGDGSFFAEQAEKEALAKKQKDWNNRIQKYRDIMDIKGMNKQAAYKSLTDASKLIQESGDFKGDIKSGKLINQVIQAASKQFDKPAKTSDAINTLILQNELKKDLSAETDALDKEYKRGRIAVDKKTLNPSFSDMKVAARKNMDGQSAWDAAAASTSNNFRGNIIPNSEWVKIKKDIKEKSGEVDDITIIANWTTETIKDKNVPDGDYTVGDALVTIQNNQVTNVNR